MPNVQPRPSRPALHAEISQFRQRSALSFSSMASQSANPRGIQNQDGALCSLVPSICGAVNRHPPPRVLGPYPVLDKRRPRKQAGRFQGLFQPSSRTYRTPEPPTRGRTAAADREARIVPMAISLPRPVSDIDTCFIPQLRFLTPSLDQQHSLANWTTSSLRTPVNRVSQVSATAIKSASNINSPATREPLAQRSGRKRYTRKSRLVSLRKQTRYTGGGRGIRITHPYSFYVSY